MVISIDAVGPNNVNRLRSDGFFFSQFLPGTSQGTGGVGPTPNNPWGDFAAGYADRWTLMTLRVVDADDPTSLVGEDQCVVFQDIDSNGGNPFHEGIASTLTPVDVGSGLTGTPTHPEVAANGMTGYIAPGPFAGLANQNPPNQDPTAHGVRYLLPGGVGQFLYFTEWDGDDLNRSGQAMRINFDLKCGCVDYPGCENTSPTIQ